MTLHIRDGKCKILKETNKRMLKYTAEITQKVLGKIKMRVRISSTELHGILELFFLLSF